MIEIYEKLYKNLDYFKIAFETAHGEKRKQIISHLERITPWTSKGSEPAPAMQAFLKWFSENKFYLFWNDQKKRWELVDSAKRAGVAFNIWNLIPQEARLTWSTLSDEEKANLIAEAEKNLLEQEEKEPENPEQETSGEKVSQPSETESSE